MLSLISKPFMRSPAGSALPRHAHKGQATSKRHTGCILTYMWDTITYRGCKCIHLSWDRWHTAVCVYILTLHILCTVL